MVIFVTVNVARAVTFVHKARVFTLFDYAVGVNYCLNTLLLRLGYVFCLDKISTYLSVFPKFQFYNGKVSFNFLKMCPPIKATFLILLLF